MQLNLNMIYGHIQDTVAHFCSTDVCLTGQLKTYLPNQEECQNAQHVSQYVKQP